MLEKNFKDIILWRICWWWKNGNSLLLNYLGGHNLLLIEKIKDKDIRKIYAENTIKNRWSRNVLSIQIETEFHKRIGNSNNNFNAMLPPKIVIS